MRVGAWACRAAFVGGCGVTAVALPVLAADGEHWADDALCREVDPEFFHPPKGGSPAAAKAVCGRCRVQRECLRWAVETDTRDGILGGMSPRERRRLTLAVVDSLPPVVLVDDVIPAGRPIPVVPGVRPRPIPETRPVPELDDVVDQAVAAPAPAVVKKTRAKVAVCGTLSGYSRHNKAGEPACEPCKQAKSDHSRAYNQAHKPPKTPRLERKPAVQVLWLVPAMPGPGHLEYAVDDGTRWSLVGAETAAVLMAQGDPVHCRTVTDWAPITRGTP